jgi:Fic family protein
VKTGKHGGGLRPDTMFTCFIKALSRAILCRLTSSQKAYLKAHKLLMSGLIKDAGKYRTGNVGIFKGREVAHLAPPAWNVQNLMDKLFHYLKKGQDNLIIKSCVFHYVKPH